MRGLCLFLGLSVAVGCGSFGDAGPAAGQSGARWCTLAGCIEGARFTGPFAVEGRDVEQLVLRACINAVCDESTLSLRPVPQADCHSPLHPWCLVWVDRTKTSLWLDINLPLPSGADGKPLLREDDVYTVSLSSPGAAPWIELRAKAPYRTFYPNGVGCDPVCHAMTLQPVNSSQL